MVFSYQWLNNYIRYTLSPQDIEDLLTMHAFEVESLEERGKDWLLDISVLPNRASDALSHRGMAREINAIAGVKGTFSQKEAEADVDLDTAKKWRDALPRLEDVTVNVEQGEDCALYYALKISGVKITQSPQWLKEQLEAVGQESINNLVDISNYVMLDLQQPTHVFDAARIEGNFLQVRRARQKESFELLGGTKAALTTNDIVIADAKKPLAVAGVKGGKDSGVSDQTQDIIIEVANFNPTQVYKTAATLHLATDSAKRFSAGISYDTAAVALYHYAQLIGDIAGGTIVGLAMHQAKEALQHWPLVMIDLNHLDRLAGQAIPKEVVHTALASLGFDMEHESGSVYKVRPPYWRIDCKIWQDIAEEVVRLYGLDTIKPKAPLVALGETVYEDAIQWRSFIRNYFVGQGFDEMYNYSFVPASEAQDTRLVPLLNPLSEDKALLRDSLTDGLLKNIQNNEGFFPQMKLFEIGKVFWQDEGMVREEEHVAGIIYNRKRVDFREARGWVEGLLEAAGFDEDDYILEPTSHTSRKPFLMLSLEGKEAGSIYIPSFPPGIKIKGYAVAFELRLNIFYEAVTNEREFQAPPRFPAVVRDISLILPRDVKGDNVIQIVHEIGKELIEDVDLFDVYEEEGRNDRNLAFHIIYRSSEKTLTDQEINELHRSIEQALATRLHGKIR